MTSGYGGRSSPSLLRVLPVPVATCILVFAFLLRRYVSKRTARTIGYRRACVVAAAALTPIQAATWIVTLTQRGGGDDLVVIGALGLAMAAVIVLTEALSEIKTAEIAGAS